MSLAGRGCRAFDLDRLPLTFVLEVHVDLDRTRERKERRHGSGTGDDRDRVPRGEIGRGETDDDSSCADDVFSLRVDRDLRRVPSLGS